MKNVDVELPLSLRARARSPCAPCAHCVPCFADVVRCLAGAVDMGPVVIGHALGHDLGHAGLGALIYQPRNRLTPQQRVEAVNRLRAGESRRALALEYNVHPVTLWRLNKKRV